MSSTKVKEERLNMENNKKIDKVSLFVSLLLIFLAVGFFVFIFIDNINNVKKQEEGVVLKPSIPEFFEQSPREGLREALKYYNIKDDSIVYCIAYLETGNFNSRLCVEDNNLFGLYDSYNDRFFKFEHWTDAVIAYRDKVEYKRKEGEDIYTFLNRITYAEDPDYIYKLKVLKERL